MTNPRGRASGKPQNRYAKDLCRTTSVRIDEDLRKEAEETAKIAGMVFSQFLRQSLRRNIDFHKRVEKEMVEKSFGDTQ
jgi:hypothetical protein